MKKGQFAAGPVSPEGVEPLDYRGLQKLIADTRSALQKVEPAEIDALEGKDFVIPYGDMKLLFTTEGFLLSASLPNFYFHATTAYVILRAKGVPIGKRDYLGQFRMKR
jgi:hypothetical protein